MWRSAEDLTNAAVIRMYRDSAYSTRIGSCATASAEAPSLRSTNATELFTEIKVLGYQGSEKLVAITSALPRLRSRRGHVCEAALSPQGWPDHVRTRHSRPKHQECL